MLLESLFTGFDPENVHAKASQLFPSNLTLGQIMISELNELTQDPEFIKATIFFNAETVAESSTQQITAIEAVIHEVLNSKYQPNSFTSLLSITDGLLIHEADHYRKLRELRSLPGQLIPMKVTLVQTYSERKLEYDLVGAVTIPSAILNELSPLEIISIVLAPRIVSGGDKVHVQAMIYQLQRLGQFTREVAQSIQDMCQDKLYTYSKGPPVPLQIPELDKYLNPPQTKRRNRK